MMTKYDPLVRLYEILPIFVDLAWSGAAIIESQDPRGDPLRVEAISDRVGAQRRHQNINAVYRLIALGGQDDVSERPGEGNGDPYEEGDGFFHGDVCELGPWNIQPSTSVRCSGN